MNTLLKHIFIVIVIVLTSICSAQLVLVPPFDDDEWWQPSTYPPDHSRLGYHYAIDFNMVDGTTISKIWPYAPTIDDSGRNIRAAHSGKIILCNWNGVYGNSIIIESLDYPEYKTRYAHLDRFAPDIHLNTLVNSGDLIGYCGNTTEKNPGMGSHLHFELLRNDVRQIIDNITFSDQPISIVYDDDHSYGGKLDQRIGPPIKGLPKTLPPAPIGRLPNDICLPIIDCFYHNGGSLSVGVAYDNGGGKNVHRWAGGWAQDFRGGSGGDGTIILKGNDPTKGTAYWIHGSIRDKWFGLGCINSPLGWPTSDEKLCASSVSKKNGRYTLFDNGIIVHYDGQSIEVHSGIFEKYRELKFWESKLGFPTSDEVNTYPGIAPSPRKTKGAYNRFETPAGGTIQSIYWSPVGAFPVYSSIATVFETAKGTGGEYGFPIGDPEEHNAKFYQHFEGGKEDKDGRWIPGIPPKVLGSSTTRISNPSIIFVIDRSGSITGAQGVMSDIQKDAEGFVTEIRLHAAQAAVINFSGQGACHLDADFTDNNDRLLSAIRNPSILTGGTALFDAIVQAIQTARNNNTNPIVVVLTDGGENSSQANLERAIIQARSGKGNIPIICVGYIGTEGRYDKDLRKLSDATSGFYANSEDLSISKLLGRVTDFKVYKDKTSITGSSEP